VRNGIALVALLLSGCAGNQPDEQARLHGVVEVGPIPGPCVVDRPCSRPTGGVALVFSRPGHERIRTTTDERGRYAAKVEPGTYRIRAANYPSPASISPTTVTIVTDTRLDLSIDSGVRSASGE
jgi:hypothetical protein